FNFKASLCSPSSVSFPQVAVRVLGLMQLGTDESVLALTYSENSTGKTLVDTKVRYNWEVSIDGKTHSIEFTNTKTSGKKRIFVDGRLLHESTVYRSPNFQYSWPIGGHLLSIVPVQQKTSDSMLDSVLDTFSNKLDCTFEMRINGLPFRAFRRQAARPVPVRPSRPVSQQVPQYPGSSAACPAGSNATRLTPEGAEPLRGQETYLHREQRKSVEEGRRDQKPERAAPRQSTPWESLSGGGQREDSQPPWPGTEHRPRESDPFSGAQFADPWQAREQGSATDGRTSGSGSKPQSGQFAGQQGKSPSSAVAEATGRKKPQEYAGFLEDDSDGSSDPGEFTTFGAPGAARSSGSSMNGSPPAASTAGSENPWPSTTTTNWPQQPAMPTSPLTGGYPSATFRATGNVGSELSGWSASPAGSSDFWPVPKATVANDPWATAVSAGQAQPVAPAQLAASQRTSRNSVPTHAIPWEPVPTPPPSSMPSSASKSSSVPSQPLGFTDLLAGSPTGARIHPPSALSQRPPAVAPFNGEDLLGLSPMSDEKQGTDGPGRKSFEFEVPSAADIEEQEAIFASLKQVSPSQSKNQIQSSAAQWPSWPAIAEVATAAPASTSSAQLIPVHSPTSTSNGHDLTAGSWPDVWPSSRAEAVAPATAAGSWPGSEGWDSVSSSNLLVPVVVTSPVSGSWPTAHEDSDVVSGISAVSQSVTLPPAATLSPASAQPELQPDLLPVRSSSFMSTGSSARRSSNRQALLAHMGLGARSPLSREVSPAASTASGLWPASALFSDPVPPESSVNMAVQQQDISTEASSTTTANASVWPLP
ncbi:unnamed protein product, partial [Polarella glacialis]